MEFFLCVLGLTLVVEGLPFFGFPEKMKSLMAFWQEQDDGSLRIVGAILVVTGLTILFFARSGLQTP